MENPQRLGVKEYFFDTEHFIIITRKYFFYFLRGHFKAQKNFTRDLSKHFFKITLRKVESEHRLQKRENQRKIDFNYLYFGHLIII